jgi:hypothetical protein
VNWSLALRKDQTMKRKRHTEEQIIAILKEHEAGVKTADCDVIRTAPPLNACQFTASFRVPT